MSQDPDDFPLSDPTCPTLREVTLTRRALLGGAAAAGVMWIAPRAEAASTLTFAEVAHGQGKDLVVPSGHHVDVVARWGDPVAKGAPAFDPARQSKAGQRMQFGFNNDYLAYLPLPKGSKASDHGLLVVNHEYTEAPMMFPGSPGDRKLSRAQAEVCLMAYGQSVIEVRRTGGRWAQVEGSAYGRRIHAETPMVFSGPAAGDRRLRTTDHPKGMTTLGTFANCAGGVTPWGTVLVAEENLQDYFRGDPDKAGNEAAALKRYGFGLKPRQSPGYHFRRFQFEREPHGPNHVGWMVEIDPYDPDSIPIKHTALGRLKHEGAGLFVDKNRRLVAYMGDDQRFEYIYRYVSEGTYDPGAGSANRALLEKGTLSVAVFGAGGSLRWHPLQFGQGPLTPANGFRSQADVLIEARRAADLLGATRMDRPEDLEVNPVTGTVFVMLTKNKKRNETNPPNPREANSWGQILELRAPAGDHASAIYFWDHFLVAGKPGSAPGTKYHKDTSENGWFSCPDNCSFDSKGRLWISSDGTSEPGTSNGVWACDVTGPGRGLTRQFLRAPMGAEITGPFFTPDDTTFFCSVQHPAEGTSFEDPSTRWPDFDPRLPPRPSVVAVTRKDNGPIG